MLSILNVFSDADFVLLVAIKRTVCFVLSHKFTIRILIATLKLIN